MDAFTGTTTFSVLAPITRSYRATYIQVIELARPLFRHVSVLPPGQNDDPESTHYGDQRELAGYWLLKSAPFTRGEIER